MKKGQKTSGIQTPSLRVCSEPADELFFITIPSPSRSSPGMA